MTLIWSKCGNPNPVPNGEVSQMGPTASRGWCTGKVYRSTINFSAFSHCLALISRMYASASATELEATLIAWPLSFCICLIVFDVARPTPCIQMDEAWSKTGVSVALNSWRAVGEDNVRMRLRARTALSPLLYTFLMCSLNWSSKSIATPRIFVSFFSDTSNTDRFKHMVLCEVY